MSFSKTASEIRRGIWAIEHQTAVGYLPLVANILSGKKIQDTDFKKQEATRYVVDEDGNRVGKDSLSGGYPEGSVGVVEIVGPMIKYGNYYCWGADELVHMAKTFDEDPNIIGQIWKIDTGGGAVSAVAPYLDFLENKKKPVVGLADLCASAGIWVASATDVLIAENEINAAFGSIGVMSTFYTYEKYMKDLGIKEHVVYADQSSEKNKDYEEARKGNYKLLKERTLNPLAEKFQNDIKSYREGKIKENVHGILNGRMFYAREALNHGLIDSIGNMQDAIKTIRLQAAAREYNFQ